jgi:hypothetical protein
MSRTDAHTPFAVRIARGEIGAHEEHDHRSGDCDLPERDACRSITTRCTWTWSWTGVAICACELCHAGVWRRRQNRHGRHSNRVEISAARKVWNGGNPDSFDEVVQMRQSY